MGKGHFLAQVPSKTSVKTPAKKTRKAASGLPFEKANEKRIVARINLVKVKISAKYFIS